MNRKWKAAALAAGIVIVLTAACSGGGGGSSPPPGQRTVALRANTQVTPWASGGLEFQVSPALTGTESMWCSVDGAQERECRVDSRTGRTEYADLPLGEHRLAVRAGKPGDTGVQTLKWRIASPAVVVYGGTPAGITAAITAAKAGHDVVLIEAGSRLGGMVTGGLSKTDASGGEAIGGLTKSFFDRARAREEAIGACSKAHPCPAHFDVGAGVAMELFTAMLAEQPRISLQRELAIRSVQRQGNRIVSVTTSRGDIEGGVFIDATYEGDLMAQAGVSHVSGREARRHRSRPGRGRCRNRPFRPALRRDGGSLHRAGSTRQRAAAIRRGPAGRLPAAGKRGRSRHGLQLPPVRDGRSGQPRVLHPAGRLRPEPL
jgi:hypothetical protein